VVAARQVQYNIIYFIIIAITAQRLYSSRDQKRIGGVSTSYHFYNIIRMRVRINNIVHHRGTKKKKCSDRYFWCCSSDVANELAHLIRYVAILKLLRSFAHREHDVYNILFLTSLRAYTYYTHTLQLFSAVWFHKSARRAKVVASYVII